MALKFARPHNTSRIDCRAFREVGPLRHRYGDSLVELALNRLEHGDVSKTRHGTRVALRPDLGDDRVEAGAYWPKGRWNEDQERWEMRCRCWSFKASGMCSHCVAAELFEEVTDNFIW